MKPPAGPRTPAPVAVLVLLVVPVVACPRPAPAPEAGSGPPPLLRSVVTDPPGNLRGDRERTYLDLLEASVHAEGDDLVFAMQTRRPFPDRADMTDGKRLDLIWFVDADRSRTTGQSPRGNDYNLHAFLDERGWHPSWYKVSEISARDGIDVSLDRIRVRVRGSRVELVAPRHYLPADSFDWWATTMTGNAPAWPPRTSNPPTQTGTVGAMT